MLSQLDLLLLEELLGTSAALFPSAVPAGKVCARSWAEGTVCTPAQLPSIPRVQHLWLLSKAMNKLVSEGQVARRHFATDLFPCELMKRYTQFQKKKNLL